MPLPQVCKDRRVFSITEARSVLPIIQRLTEDAAGAAESLVGDIEKMSEDDPDFEASRQRLEKLVNGWSEKEKKLGCLAKGVWNVEFDNGHGYYAWSFPETDIDFYHSYDSTFDTRIRIC